MAIKDNVQGVVLALFGASAGGHLTTLTGTANANGLTALAGDLAGSAGFILGKDLSTADAFRDNMLTGLGIPSTNAAYADAKAWADAELAKPAANRGEIVATAVTYLAGLTDAASPFFAAATAFNTKVAAAVTWSEGAGATVFGVAALQAQQGTAPVSTGQTFTLLPATDDVKGTAGDDTIVGSSAAISTLDSVDGGAGNDTFIINNSATTVAAIDVKNVENVVFNVKTFAGSTLDAANIDSATITVNKGAVGYSTSATVSNAGDNTIVAGAGLTGTLTITGSDEGVINVGSAASINLDVAAAANDLIFVVSNTSKTAVTDGTTGTETTSVTVTGGVGSVDLKGSAALTGGSITDVLLGDGAKLVLDSRAIDTGFAVTGNGILEFAGGTAAAHTVDVEDSDATVKFQIGDISDTTLAFTNADGKTFVLNAANTTSEITKIDTTDIDDGTAKFTVNVNKSGTALAIGTNADHVDIVMAAAGSFASLKVAGDVTINVGANAFTADTTLALTQTNATDVVHFVGSGPITLSNVTLSNIDASEVTGIVTLATNSSSPANSEISLGSAADTYTAGASGTAGVSVEFGAGNDTAVMNAAATGNYFLAGEAGDDVFVLGTSAASFDDRGSGVMAIDGGEGSDTVKVGISAATDLSGGSFDIDNVEVLQISGSTLTIDAKSLSADTLTIKGSSTSASDGLILTTSATSTKVDLANITVDSSLDTLEIDASAMLSTGANTITATAFDEEITFDVGSTGGLTINAAAGDDTLTAEAGTLGKTISITLGAGDDILDVSAATSTAAKLFSVKDYAVGVDTIKTGTAIVSNNLVGVDVKAGTTQSSSDITAKISGGIVTISGADAGNVDTLQEWINVVTIATASGKTAGFVFGGNTYVLDVSTTGAPGTGVVDNVVELVGITASPLGVAGAANILTSV